MKALKNQFYECVKIDSDTAIKYATLDAWAKFPDFKVRLANAIARQQALDRIMIGWNGTSAAATSDRTANPLLQDVAIGWLQHIRADAPDQVFDEGAVANKVTYGTHAAADYKTLDGLVFDNIERLASWYKDDPDMVVVVGRGLMHDKLFPLMNAPSSPYAPTEALAADIVISQKRLGGLQAVQVPFFPAGKALITKLSNLSIYYQMSARRRAVIDNPKRDQIENYESSNDAYVVEDYDACVLVENIEAKDA
jgi:P2 family phage major capsid protein